MKTIKLIIAAFSFGLLLSSCASKAPISATSAEPMGDFVADYIKRHNIPGASLAVSYQGKIIYAKGFGFADIESKKAPPSRHRFSYCQRQ